jgi:hypothetical protein
MPNIGKLILFTSITLQGYLKYGLRLYHFEVIKEINDLYELRENTQLPLE